MSNTFAEKFALNSALNYASVRDALAIYKFLLEPPSWVNEDQGEILNLFARKLEYSKTKRPDRQSFAVASPGFGKTHVHIGLMAALRQDPTTRNRLFIWVTLNHRTIEAHKTKLHKFAPHLFREDEIAVLSGTSKDEVSANTRLVIATPTMFAKVANGEVEHDLLKYINHNTVFMPDETHVLLTDLRSSAVSQIRKANCLDLGLTATPAFSDGRTVGEIAYGGQDPFFILPTRVAVQKGYNCSIGMGIYDVSIQIDRAAIKQDLLAQHPGIAKPQLNTLMRSKIAQASLEGRIRAMVTSWGTERNPYTGKALFKTKTIDFMPDTDSADEAARLYNEMYGSQMPPGKMCAASIHSKMHPREQQRIYEAHKRGDIYVLTNVRCLATAHDDPEVENVSIIWETKSELLLQQEIGRAFRYNRLDLKKFAFARQWVDLEHNPDAVLITEALDSYDPLVRFDFSGVEDLAAKADHEEVISGEISYQMNTSFKALEAITKLAKSRRLKNSSLPPAPLGYVNINELIHILKGNADSLKARESASLRKLFMSIERAFRETVTLPDTIHATSVNDESAELNFTINAVYAGTVKGNMLHVNFDEIKKLLSSIDKFKYLDFANANYSPPADEEVSEGTYITIAQAGNLIFNLAKEIRGDVQFDDNDRFHLLQYLKSCPAETKKTPIGVSTKHQADEYGKTTGITIHARELANYVLSRIGAEQLNDLKVQKIEAQAERFDQEYPFVEDESQLFVECTSEKITEVFQSFGFATDSKDFEQLLAIFEEIAYTVRKYKIEHSNNSETIEVHENTFKGWPTDEKECVFQALVYGKEKNASCGFYYENGNLDHYGSVANPKNFEGARSRCKKQVFYTTYRYDPDNKKVYVALEEVPWGIFHCYASGKYNNDKQIGDKFSNIKYDKKAHKLKGNSVKHFVHAKVSSINALLKEYNIAFDENDIEAFVKAVNKHAKNAVEHNIGCSPNKDDIPDYRYTYWKDKSIIDEQKFPVLWSDVPYGQDVTRNIEACVPQHIVLDHFMHKQVAKSNLHSDLTDSDIAKLCEAQVSKERSYVTGFTTNLKSKRVFTSSQVAALI